MLPFSTEFSVCCTCYGHVPIFKFDLKFDGGRNSECVIQS